MEQTRGKPGDFKPNPPAASRAGAQARALLGLLVLGLLLAGCGYAIYLGDQLRYPDERDYYALAHNLATQQRYTLDGSTPTAFRPPGYPLLLSLLLYAGAQVVHLRILNFLLLAAAALLLYQLLAQRATPGAGLLAALLLAGYPLLFYTAGTLYPQTLALLLFVLVLFLALRAPRRRFDVPLAGGLFGYLILTVPLFALLLPVLLLLLALLERRPERWRTLALLLLACLLVVGPWSLRNYLVFGRPVFVAANGGLNLLLGNSEHTTPNAGVNVDISHYRRQAAQLDEVDRDRFYASSAVAWIREHKQAALLLYLKKTANYFNYRNELYVQSEASPLRDLVMALSYYPLVMIVLLRLLRAGRHRLSHVELVLIVLYLASAFASAIFFTRIRFRVPFEPLLIGAAAIALERWRLALLARRARRLSGDELPSSS